MRSSLLLVALTLVLAACGKDHGTSRGYADSGNSIADAQNEANQKLGSDGSRARAVWDQVPGADAWTSAALTEIQARRASFEATRDRDDFCPEYASATSFQKDTCWLRLLSAMARYESNLRPSATYLESTGHTSVGLLMMNPDHCPDAATIELLKDPGANIHCAAERLETLVLRDGWISGAGNLGGAAYWSVLRAPYQVGSLTLGRRPHIVFFTKTYRGFRNPSAP